METLTGKPATEAVVTTRWANAIRYSDVTHIYEQHGFIVLQSGKEYRGWFNASDVISIRWPAYEVKS